MGTIIPDTGLDWFANKSLPGEPDTDLQYVAVGTGTASVASDDTALANESYRADIANGNGSISLSSNTGTLRVSITVSGGTEVPAGEEITELGVLTEEDELTYREVRDTITVENGERITFQFPVSFIN